MGFDQKGTTVFCVSQRGMGQWDVSEEGFEKPLASFNSEADARKYAEDLARTKEGSQVKVMAGNDSAQQSGSGMRGGMGS